MAIDRSQMVPPLRNRVIATSAAVSAILCALLPAAALIMFVLGGILYAVCKILAWGAIIGVVVMVIYALSRDSSRNNSENGCGIIIAGVVVLVVFAQVHTPLLRTADSLLDSCQTTAVWLFHDLFWTAGFVWMSWIPFATHLLLILFVLLLVAVCCLEHSARYIVHKVRLQCPACDHDGTPHFRCPHTGCNHILTDLRPSCYGIFTARCGHCRNAVSTMDLFGRGRYQTVCPVCARSEIASQKTSEFYFGMVGAPSAGKSVALVSGIDRLQKGFAPANRLQATMEPADQAFVNDSLDELRKNKLMAKTGTGAYATAIRVHLQDKDDPADSTLAYLYFYDVDGGLFQNSSGLDRMHYDRRLDGIILIVDPFAETAFRDATQLSEYNDSQVNPGRTPVLEVLEAFVAQLEARMNILGSDRQRIDIPVSVILAKVDAGGLSEVLSPPFPEADAASPDILLAHVEADSHHVRTIMTSHGLERVVKRVENNFQRVRYFATAALDPHTGDYAPQGMLHPFLWLMNESHVFQTGLKFSVFHAKRVFLRVLRGREGERARLILIGSMMGLLCLLASLLWLVVSGWSNRTSKEAPDSAHVRPPQPARPMPANPTITPPPVVAVIAAPSVPRPQAAPPQPETPAPLKAVPVVTEPAVREAIRVVPDMPQSVPKAIALTPEEEATYEPKPKPKPKPKPVRQFTPYRVKIVKHDDDGLLRARINPGQIPISFRVEVGNKDLICTGPEIVVNGFRWCPVRLYNEHGWVRSEEVQKFP